MREDEQTVEDEGRRVLFRSRQTIRLRLASSLGPGLRWRADAVLVEFAEEVGERSRGGGIRQEILWSPSPWSTLSVRSGICRAESYDARVYFLEPDPIRNGTLTGYSTPAEFYSFRLQLRALGGTLALYHSLRSVRRDPWQGAESDRMYGFRISR
jgi:hypothetical protein